jgi:predicted kinase
MSRPTPDIPTKADDLPILVIVCGLPATGKSGLAEKLREELRWPLFAKDHFKELLYDATDQGEDAYTREASIIVGKQSIALLFAVARELLEARVSCIIEANFLPALAPCDLAPLLAIADGRQVHCTIPDDLVLERYRQRASAGERHPVHVDEGAEAELIERIESGGGKPLAIAAPLLQVDSTEGYQPGLDEIVAFCRR